MAVLFVYIVVGAGVLIYRPKVSECIVILADGKQKLLMIFVVVACLCWPVMRTAVLFTEWFFEIVGWKKP